MNMKLKMIVAAIALASAGQASATLSNSYSTAYSSVFLNVWDGTSSYVRDLGLTVDQFLTNNGDGTISLTGLAPFTSTAGSIYTSLFGADAASSIHWNVMGVYNDQANGSDFSSSLLSTGTVANSASNIGVGNGIGNVDGLITNANALTGANKVGNEYNATSLQSTSAGPKTSNFFSYFQTGNNSTTAGNTLGLYSLVQSGNNAVQGALSNDTLTNLNFTLAQDGTLTASAVPLPAAAWLLGSGLLGLFGVGRRRSKAAALAA